MSNSSLREAAIWTSKLFALYFRNLSFHFGLIIIFVAKIWNNYVIESKSVSNSWLPRYVANILILRLKFIIRIITLISTDFQNDIFSIVFLHGNIIISFNLLSTAILAIPIAFFLLWSEIQLYNHSLMRIECYVSHVQV